MPRLTLEASTVIARQLGLINARQLAEAGVGRNVRRHLRHVELFGRTLKSVYTSGAGSLSREQQYLALTLAHPGAFLTGPTLGKLLSLRRMPTLSTIHIEVRHGQHHASIPGVTFRQSTKITDLDHRTLDNGTEVATWPRLLFDLAADLPRLDLVSATDHALTAQHCTLEELGAIARRLAHQRRPGSHEFVEMLMERGGRAAVDSHPELLVLEALRSRQVPVEPQHRPLDLPDGTTIRIDLAVPEVRWAVEIDVHPYHLGLDGTTRDHRRDRQLHLIEWQVEHVTALDLLDLPGLCDELVALYLRRTQTFRTAA